jgi:hypothetical protein
MFKQIFEVFDLIFNKILEKKERGKSMLIIV